MNRPTLPILLILAAMAGGCASMAQKTPTPADDITPQQAAAITAPPGVRYFILVFGSQETPKRPKYTHTWATIVKVTECGEMQAPAIEEQTISWLPSSLDIRPLSFAVEPGKNYGLRFTLEEMLRHKERISLWGPYEVIPGLAYRFAVQKSFMESGHAGYQCIDNVGEAARTGDGCNCIHSITDMDNRFDRKQYPLSYYGNSASLNIVRQLQTRPIIISPETDHGWLLPLLGLDKYPIERREYHGRTLPYTPENMDRYLRETGGG
jgi:hypothetical protein